MAKDEGGAAFPCPARETASGWLVAEPGMTMRQWYKRMALTGVMGAFTAARKHGHAPPDAEEIAAVCAEIADALIAEDSQAREEVGG